MVTDSFSTGQIMAEHVQGPPPALADNIPLLPDPPSPEMLLAQGALLGSITPAELNISVNGDPKVLRQVCRSIQKIQKSSETGFSLWRNTSCWQEQQAKKVLT